MITYLLQVSFSWVFFYLIYHLFLRKETFFNINRWYLLSTAMLSLFIPQIGAFLKMYFTATPADVGVVVYYLAETPHMISTAIEGNINSGGIEWMSLVIAGIYLVGIAIAASRMMHGLNRIYKLYKSGKKIEKENVVFVETNDIHLPFSFFHFIFLSKRLPLKKEINEIIKHEITHVEAWHSLDILLFEVLQVFFWFNPVLILYKRAIRQAHEYYADASVLKHSSIKNYGQILLGQSSSGMEVALANQFFNSQIKKRITMMYTKKSSPLSLIKYLAAIPALILSIFLFASHTSGIELDNNKENNNSEVIYGSSEILFASVDTTPPPKPPIPPKPPKAQKSINALKGIQPPVPPEPPSSMKVNRPVAPVKPNLPPTPPFPNKMEKPPTPDMPPSPPPAPKKYQNMEQPFTEVDQLPRFPGCEDMNATEKEKSSCSKKKLIQYIYQNISYPEEARKAGIQGTVVVQFVVKKDGTLEDITLLRDIGGGCGEASHHIIASMNEMEERWVPGKHEGKSVDVMYTIPVKFTLENGSGKNDNKGSNENKEKGEIKKEDDSIVGFNPNNGSLMIIDKDKIEPLIILDGKETQRGVSSIHPDDIATINVLKGKTAFEKYGQKGENGVIEITTKNGNKKKISFSADKVVLDKNKVILEGNAKVEDKGIELKADKINYYSISESDNSIDKENSPLIVLDGIVVGNDTSIYKEIDPQQIKEINVLKGESALSKYGQKGINGVVEISRKKHLKKSELSETNNNIIFLSDVKIFPNPSKGEINISFNGPANPLEIQIHAIDGKLLHTEKESDFDGTFNKTIRNKNFVNTQAIVSFIQDGKVQSEKIVFHE